MTSEVNQRLAVEIQPLGGGFGLQVIPAIPGWQLFLRPGLFRHLQKEQVGQFGDVLVIRDAIILEYIAQIPQFGNDVMRNGLGGSGQSQNPFLNTKDTKSTKENRFVSIQPG